MADPSQGSSSDSVVFPEDLVQEQDAHYVQHFIGHYWPMFVFGILFLGTLCLPMIISGVLPMEGVLIIGFFLTALAIALTIPQFMGVFLLITAGLIALNYPILQYNTAGPGLYILLGYSIVGGSLFAASKMMKTNRQLQEEQKKLTSGISTPVAVEPPSVVTPVAAEKAAEKPKAKPVAFDKTIAATGISILFGTESGNSEELAKMTADTLRGEGHTVQVLDNGVIDATHLKAFANVLVITSTWGDGDPPSNTLDLMEKMKSDGFTVDMKGAQFSVLALGDTNYEQFCKCGKDFDELFQKYGASRLYNRVDCNLDYEAPFQTWLSGVRGAFKSAGLKTVPEFIEATEPELVTA